MTDWDDRRDKRHRDPTEGVRLLGADEAAEALERDDIRRRLADDQPRFGDRPVQPPHEGPRPALRFPLNSYDDPNSIERPPVVPVVRREEAPELSHWSGSAAEEVPNMSRRDPRQVGDPWSGVDADPRWRDEPAPRRAQHAAPPPGGQGPSGPGGWPDPQQPPQSPPPGRRRPMQGTPVTFDEGVDPAPGRSVFDPGAPGPPPEPEVPGPGYDDGYSDDTYADDYDETYADELYEDEAYDEGVAGYPEPRGGMVPPPRPSRRGARRSSDRDLRSAVVVAVAFAAVALGLFKVLGPLGGMLVAVPVLAYAAYEYFVAVNTAGFEAPMPVGVAAVAGLAIAGYNYGEGALPLVLVLAVAVSFLWYLVGAGGDRPVANVGVTLLGVGWIGLFGAYAGLLLADPAGNGVALLLAALIPTIGYDVGALFVGRSAGSRPLSAASPNKTIEGLAGGMVVAVVAAVVFAAVGVAPFDDWQEGLKLGVLVALVAPLGDLAESIVKRDLGIKDMGSILPGHGGLLDRFDALLFVLPAVWYLARLSDFFLT
ncbi:MAG TPA: phosphatidate cytidylyltransferase [Acidimicrobiales bacterium]|nr:phosphatidate cytidylyltransferase [Acidimicrobiales bacterium]